MKLNVRQKRRLIASILIIIIIILIIWIVMMLIPHKNENVGDFSSVKEVVEYMNSDYIKMKNSSTKGYVKDIYVTFGTLPKENENINQKYYDDIVKLIAKVLEYKNYIIYDETNNITIKIKCNEVDKTITSYVINDDEDYFKKLKSQDEIESYEDIKVSTFEIKSSFLNNIVKNNWEKNSITLSNKTSQMDGYDIYFNDGIEIKIVNDKIFNVIFLPNYNEEILPNIKVNTTLEDIVSNLGTPTFGSVKEKLIGYKLENMYVFFSKENVSVYRREDTKGLTTISDILKNVNDNNYDLTALSSFIGEAWQDYDNLVDFPDNGYEQDYILKGVKLVVGTSKENGLYVYNNYEGTIYNEKTFSSLNKENVTIDSKHLVLKNTDLVYETEKARIDKYIFDSSNPLVNENFGLVFTSVYDVQAKNYEITGLNIVSRNKDIPNSSINKQVTTPTIIDKTRFIYGISNDGIYVYDVNTCKTEKIISGLGNFEITSYKDNILKYDGKEENIKI